VRSLRWMKNEAESLALYTELLVHMYTQRLLIDDRLQHLPRILVKSEINPFDGDTTKFG
jgi:hypothetical protein